MVSKLVCDLTEIALGEQRRQGTPICLDEDETECFIGDERILGMPASTCTVREVKNEFKGVLVEFAEAPVAGGLMPAVILGK